MTYYFWALILKYRSLYLHIYSCCFALSYVAYLKGKTLKISLTSQGSKGAVDTLFNVYESFHKGSGGLS